MKKSKIVALLMATACMATVFVGCGEDGGSCTQHADGDKNGYCDVCKSAVITITEQVPTEEAEVEMVVNAIPTGVKISEYIGPKAEVEKVDLEGAQALEVFEGKTVISSNNAKGVFVLKSEKLVSDVVGAETYKTVYEVYSALANQVIYTYTTDEYEAEESPKSSVEITLGSDYIAIKENTWSETQYYPYYSYDSKSIVCTNAGDTLYAETSSSITNDSVSQSTYGDYAYIEIDEKLSVVERETGKKVTVTNTPTDPDFYVSRPSFDVVKGDYGYVFENDTVWVYNLTEWLSCIYYNQMPSEWMNSSHVSFMVLDNGNLFIQYAKKLPDSAVNYDVVSYGEKVDYVQLIINPVTGEMTEKELGYVVDQLYEGDLEKYNDNAKNVVRLTPIEDKAENTNAAFEAVIDNDLNILYAHKPTLKGQDVGTLEYVAENVYYTQINYGDGVSVDVIVDGEGKEIAKVSMNAQEFAGGRLLVGTKVYDYDMKTVLFDIEDYTDLDEKDNYAILSKTVAELVEDVPTTVTEYYYYNASMKEPAKISGEVVNANESYFVTKLEVESATGTEVQYIMYNHLNEKVITSDKNIANCSLRYLGENASIWSITLSDGEVVYVGN